MMIKVILFFIYSLFIFSYSDFISDGNNSKYNYINHIVNTSEDKIYLAIGYKNPDRFLLEIDTSSANVIITELENIETTFSITTLKLLALKDAHNKYTGNFVLAGKYSDLGKIEHFTYTHGAGVKRESNISFNQASLGEVGPILDIIQKDGGGDLYIVSHQNAIWKNILNITDNNHTFIAGRNIYEGYLKVAGKNIQKQSYLAQINKDNVSIIVREFSYILGPSIGNNVTSSTPNTFFTLGFNGDGNITIVGTNPIHNLGSKLTILSINASKSNVTGATLNVKAPVLLKPKYELIQNQPKGTLVEVGSTVYYGPKYNESNTLQIIGPAKTTAVIVPKDIPFSMTREGNISKLIQGFYNASLGSPYDTIINWLDVNCSKQALDKYIIPWSEAQIQALTGTLTNQTENKTDYELCRINEKFIYEQANNNVTLLQRKWGFTNNPEDSILWMQDIPNDKIKGNPPTGRTETITTDNTSIIMLTQSDNVVGGINLLRVIDSTTGVIKNRIKWHKTYFTGLDANNTPKVTLNGPNLLKTIANDFIIAGKIQDNTRVSKKKFDCMVIKIDKNGNELWTKNLGGFHNDNCYSVALEKNNTSPFYNDYVAVGESGTRNKSGGLDLMSYGIKFRDEGTLFHLREGWNLIANGTDRNITAQGKKEESNTMGVTNLGSYKSYFQFIKNQWLINQYPIESLTGFWIYMINGKQDIFLEGNLLEQKFQGNDLGWVLLGTGVKLVNTKRKFNLNSLWKFKNGRWIESPSQINSGEGFWAKKKE